MKNTFKLFVMITFIAVIGFLCLGCNNDSTSSGGTYTTFTGGGYSLGGAWATDFGGTEPASPGYYEFGTNDRGVLLDYCNGHYSNYKNADTTLSEIESKLQEIEEQYYPGYPGLKADVLAELNANGYCLVGTNNGSDIMIMAAFKN